MNVASKKRPPVPGRSAIPGHGSDLGNGGAGGARNPRVNDGYRKRLTLATYNGRTLRLDEHITELETELSHIKWHMEKIL